MRIIKLPRLILFQRPCEVYTWLGRAAQGKCRFPRGRKSARGSDRSTTTRSWAQRRGGLEKQAPREGKTCRCLSENASKFSGKLLRPSRMLWHHLHGRQLIAMPRRTETMPIKWHEWEQNLALLVCLESVLPTDTTYSGIKYWENAGWMGHISFCGHCGRKGSAGFLCTCLIQYDFFGQMTLLWVINQWWALWRADGEFNAPSAAQSCVWLMSMCSSEKDVGKGCSSF